MTFPQSLLRDSYSNKLPQQIVHLLRGNTVRVQLLVLVVYAWMCVDPFSSYLNDTSIGSRMQQPPKKNIIIKIYF